MCDRCFGLVSPGAESTSCLLCNVVAHTTCVRDAAHAVDRRGAQSCSSENNQLHDSEGGYRKGENWHRRGTWICRHCAHEQDMLKEERGTSGYAGGGVRNLHLKMKIGMGMS